MVTRKLGRETYDPSILQRNHMINIHIRRRRPLPAIVGARPGAARGVAVGADDDAGAVSLQHVLTRVAGPLDRVPCRE